MLAEDFCKQLAALPLNRWPGMPMWGLSHSLHARVIRMSTKETLFLGSTTVSINCFHRSDDSPNFILGEVPKGGRPDQFLLETFEGMVSRTPKAAVAV